MYLASITVFFFIGGIFALLFRIELLTPKGDFLEPDTYNKFFTLHGVIMIFFFLIPSVPATLGNFLVPLMVGARDLAFPKINLLSYHVYVGGGIMARMAISRPWDTLDEVREEQTHARGSYGIVSEEPEIYRIPVQVAMEIVAEKGLVKIDAVGAPAATAEESSEH